MTGDEHYSEAERLVTLENGSTWAPGTPQAIAVAQVHATLALAAATAAAAPAVPEWSEEHQAYVPVRRIPGYGQP